MKFSVKQIGSGRGRPRTLNWEGICEILGSEYAAMLGLRRRRSAKPLEVTAANGDVVRVRKLLSA